AQSDRGRHLRRRPAGAAADRPPGRAQRSGPGHLGPAGPDHPGPAQRGPAGQHPRPRVRRRGPHGAHGKGRRGERSDPEVHRRLTRSGTELPPTGRAAPGAVHGEGAMASSVRGIPEGYHSLTPYLAVDDGARAIAFYQEAFGASEVMRMARPNGKVGHAELQIGDSRIMLADAYPDMGFRSP